jgi:glucose/arabinose dehydrogenase
MHKSVFSMIATATFVLASCSGGESPDVEASLAPDTSMAAEPTTTESTSPPETSTTLEEETEGLEPIKILSVGAGGGSGEMTIVVDEKPEGWVRFKVSLDGPDSSSMRAKILDVQDMGSGVAIIVSVADYSGGAPMTVAVSWANEADVTSALAYAKCSNGVPLSGNC